jgi:hypothetical protein
LTVVNGTGSGSYNSNTVVSISANTISNELFANWSGLDIANTNSANTTVTMPAANLIVTVNYTPAPPPSYTLTVANGSGSGTYNSDAVVSISANTISNELFANWSGLDIANTNSANTSITMPASNLTVTANYTPVPPPSYTLTVVNGTGSGTYNSAAVVSISASLNSPGNGSFTNWSGLYIANTNSANTTVSMPASNLTVTANYAPLPPSNLRVARAQ